MNRDERQSRAESASEFSRAAQVAGADGLEADGIQLGCSMLSRIRLKTRAAASMAPMRCSLGYALHGDADVAKCRAVDGPSDCWMSAPSWRVAAPEPERKLARRARRESTIAVYTEQVTIETPDLVVELTDIRISADNDVRPET